VRQCVADDTRTYVQDCVSNREHIVDSVRTMLQKTQLVIKFTFLPSRRMVKPQTWHVLD